MTEEDQISLFAARRAREGKGNVGPLEDPEAFAPGGQPETALTVSEVNAAARELLEERFPELWVNGEIANWRRVSSGHCYFSLRDDSAQISCVMWQSDARRLPTDPEEGMEVSARGQISLYEARGTYQLRVSALEATGEGLWRLAFERLKKKLAAEGLLDDARKRPVPRIPATVGVVTSRSGAALQDVLSVIHRRAPWTRVLISHSRVQGEEAAPEIVQALERLERTGIVDVIVLTRGGGSVEDLWAFNEEAVARSVAGCSVPVISAVGHEVDVTIADLVADVRAPTPSAAGEIVVPDSRAIQAKVGTLARGLADGLRQRARRGRERAELGAERLVNALRRQLQRSRSRIERLGGRLDALSPLSTLARGYSVARSPEGRVLCRRDQFVVGDSIRLRVVDAEIGCRVEEIEARDSTRVAPDGAGESEATDSSSGRTG